VCIVDFQKLNLLFADDVLQNAFNCTRLHSPSQLDCMPRCKPLRYYYVYPRVSVKYPSNWSQWCTSSLLDSTLPSSHSEEKTLPISLQYILLYRLLFVWSRGLLSCRSQVLESISGRCLPPADMRQVVCNTWCLASSMWCVVFQKAGGVWWLKL
jgi:hypothetical protein